MPQCRLTSEAGSSQSPPYQPYAVSSAACVGIQPENHSGKVHVYLDTVLYMYVCTQIRYRTHGDEVQMEMHPNPRPTSKFATYNILGPVLDGEPYL